MGLASCLLATFGPPEYYPCSKITGEVLELVYNVSRHKKAITGLERIAISISDKFTCSPMDEIDFILFVRSLRVMADRGVILNRH